MTTVTRDILSTVTDTTNIRIDISEAIDFMDPMETPMLDLVGRDSLQTPCTQVLHEWLEDEMDPRAGTLGAAYTAGSYSFTFTTGEGKYLITDDLFLVGNVVYRATGINGDVVTAELISGTDIAAASGDAWRKVAHSAQEGGMARDDMTKTALSRPYNYTQIIKDWVVVTGTMEVIKRYGYANERSYQEEKKLKELALDLENNILYGARKYTSGPPRKSSMGGLLDFILIPGITNSWSTVYNAAGAVFTETMLNNYLQAMWELGGTPDFLMLNGTNKRRVNSWGIPFIRTTRGERTAGASIGVYESDFGTLDIILNRNMRASDVIVGTRSQIGLGPLTGRQFTSRMLPSTLDGTWIEVLGEYTMEVHRPNIDFAWIYNTSTVYS